MGVLRFDLVAYGWRCAFTATGLQNSTMTSFVVPFSSGGTPAYSYIANYQCQ